MRKLIITFYGSLCITAVGCAKPPERSDTGEMLAILSVAFTIGLFVLLGKYSRLLREDASRFKSVNNQDIQSSTVVGFKEQPYSLSKVQLGIWTVVICSAYLYLTLFKNNCTEITMNKTAVVLMGIFAGSAISTKIIDNNLNITQPSDDLNRLSQGFFTDILSDQRGVSIHRFQHLLWTLIAIVIYLYRLSEITTGCALPELGDTLLALTGISSATYVVMRSGERTPPDTTPEKDFPPGYQASPPMVSPSGPGSKSTPEYNKEFYR